MEKLQKLSEALITGNHILVRELIQDCLDEGVEAGRIMELGLIAGMNVVAEGFKRNELFLPEVMMAARAMNTGLAIIDPILRNTCFKLRGKMVLGTVRGDLHDVGKNIVSMMFRGAGFKVIDLGVDVPEERFLNAVKEHEPDIVGLSALLTTTMPMIKLTIESLKQANLREGLIVMVGGAPVTQEFADQIGADGYAPNAALAIEKTQELMKARRQAKM